MELIDQTHKRTDTSLLAVTHLSQLISYLTGFGGFIIPLILWLTQRDKVKDMDEHGKCIINFQITLLLVALLCIPGIFLFGLGILGLIYVGIIGFIIPIVNAIRAGNGEAPTYFSTIRFIP